MRESVKNKRKIAFIAIAILLTMLMGITFGLLPNSPKGDTQVGTVGYNDNTVSGSDTLFDVGSEIGKAKGTPSGTPIRNITDWTNNKNSSNNLYLTNDLDITLSDYQTLYFRANLDGNGHTIRINSTAGWLEQTYLMNGNGSSKPNVDKAATYDNDTYDYYMGAFASINAGTIKNVTFELSGDFCPTNYRWEGIWGVGGVCGKNIGTIDNVKLIVKSGAKLRAMNETTPSETAGQRAVMGGICANQSGRLTNVHVEMEDNSTMSIDSRTHIWDAWNYVVQDNGMCASIIGGVYGAYTSETARNNTYNLSFTGAESSKIEALNSDRKTGGSNRNTCYNKRIFQAYGSIAGLSVQGVKGVFSQFRGKFVVNKSGELNGNVHFVTDYADKQYLAFAGEPTGYYHNGRNTNGYTPNLNMCTASEYANYFGLFSTSSASALRPYPSTDGNAHKTSDGTNNSLNRIKYQNYYLNKFGHISFNFQYTAPTAGNSTAGMLNVKKIITTGSGPNSSNPFTANDVIWDVTARGNIDNTTISENKTIAGYNTALYGYGRSIDFLVKIDRMDYYLQFTTGKKFNSLTLNNELEYTGNSFATTYPAQAITTNISSELTDNNGDANINFGGNVSYRKADGETSFEDGTSFLQYPKEARTIVLVDEDNPAFAYFNAERRVCISRITVNNFRIKPVQIAPSGITYDKDDWSGENGKNVTIKFPTTNNKAIEGAVDKIEYWKVGDETPTSVAVTGFTYANGFTFNIKENTLKSAVLAGTIYKFKLYRNNNPIAYVDNADKSAFDMKNSVGVGVKIDSKAPAFNDETKNFWKENFKDKQDVWYGYSFEKEMKFDDTFTDDNGNEFGSGIKRLDVYKVDGNTQTQVGGDWNRSYNPGSGFNITTGKFTYNTIANYKVVITDWANNTDTYEFTTQIDIFDYTKLGDVLTASDIEYSTRLGAYTPGTRVTETVNVIVNTSNIYKNDASRGYVSFAPDESDPNASSSNNTIGNASYNVTNKKWTAEIKSTYNDPAWQNTDTNKGVRYALTFTSKTVNESGEHYTAVYTIGLIWVGRNPIVLFESDINFKNITPGEFVKIYDGNSKLLPNANNIIDLRDYVDLKLSAERIAEIDTTLNDYTSITWYASSLYDHIEIRSIKFYQSEQITDEAINSNEGKDNYYLVVELWAKSGEDFALARNRYTFAVADSNGNTNSYYFEGTMTEMSRIGIDKVTLTSVSINEMVTRYGDNTVASLPEFKLSATGLVGDDITADLTTVLPVTFSVSAFSGLAGSAYPNAGKYQVTASEINWVNYKLKEGATITGDWVITKYEITDITVNNEINSITSYEVPNITATFVDAFGVTQYLKVIYKNTDFEEVKFEHGKRMPLGKYYYVILVESDTDAGIALNYTSIVLPNSLIGHFMVVGDTIVFGEHFGFHNWNENTGRIELTFKNAFYDIKELIVYHDSGLRGRVKVYYGYDQFDTTNINEVGSYFIRVVIESNDRYAEFEDTFSVVVGKATVITSVNDLVPPANLTYDNKVHALTADNISDDLKLALNNLMTDEEKKLGDYKAVFTFEFKYSRGINNDFDPNKIIDAGEYGVTMTITGNNINNIVIESEYEIAKLDLDVEFDFTGLDSTITIEKNTDPNKNFAYKLTKTFDTKAVNVAVKSSFLSKLNELTANHDWTNHSFDSNNFVNAGSHHAVYKFEGILENPCINLVNNVVEVQINKAVVELDLKDVDIDTTYDKLVNGAISTQLKYEDLAKIKALGVTLDEIKLNFNKYITSNAIEDITDLSDDDNPIIGVKVVKANDRAYEIKVELDHRNVAISNNIITIRVARGSIDVNNIGLAATYRYNGSDLTEDVVGDSFKVEYTGSGIVFDISEKGIAYLESKGLAIRGTDYNGKLVKVDNEGNALVAAVSVGKYKYLFEVTNENYKYAVLTINIEIEKKQISEYVGVFDTNTWYIREGGKEKYDTTSDIAAYSLPNDEDNELGLIYRRKYVGEVLTNAEDFMNFVRTGKDYTQQFYSMRLRDHDKLIAEGFTIKYYYNGVEAIGISQAGYHTVTAVISKGDPNWADKTVELYKLDSNGNFTYTDSLVSSDSNKVEYDRKKVVMTLDVAKAELQEEVDIISKQLQLEPVSKTYDNKAISTKYTDEQIEILKNKMYRPLITGSNTTYEPTYNTGSYTNAGEYAIPILLVMQNELNENDPNYEQAEMETSITISPMKVDIFFEYDEKFKDSNGNVRYNEGSDIKIQAYYVDFFGQKVYIDSINIEVISGSGEEIDFSSPKRDEESGDILYVPNRYQASVTINDTNYVFDDEAVDENGNPVNAFRFSIKNQSGTTNTVLYILLAVAIVMLIIAVFVTVYMIRMFNPAVQEIDVDIDIEQ